MGRTRGLLRLGRILAVATVTAVGTGLLFEATGLWDRQGFNVAGQCRIPLSVHAGRFDSRFPFSESEFRRALREAMGMWESAVNPELFRLDQSSASGMAVNLVYGDRQARAEQLSSRANDLERMEQAIETQRRKLRNRREALEQAWDDLESRQKQLKRRQEELNRLVERWNAGTMERTQSNRRRLETQRDRLESERQNLKQTRRDLERRTERLNAAFEELESEISDYQNRTAAYNKRVSSTSLIQNGQFRQKGGERTIEVYKATSINELRLVLAHELGHSLGIGHLDNRRAVMHPVMNTDNLDRTRVARDDVRALRDSCSL